MRTSLRQWWMEAEPWYLATGLANLVMGTSSILIPLMLFQVIHRSVGSLGVLSSLVSLVGVIGSLIWGRLSDAAHRRKPFVVLSFVMVSGSLAGIAFAQSFNALLVLNMILNFFWVANAAVTVLIVIENRERAQWESKIGHLNQIGALCWLSGLILGSLALVAANHHIDEATAIRALFLILAGGMLAATVLALRLIPRTIPRFTQRRFRGMIVALGNFLIERARFGPFHLYHRFNLQQLPTLLWGEGGLKPETKRLLFATWFAFIAFGLVFVPLPLLLSGRLSVPSSRIFLYYVAHYGAIALAYPWASRRIKRTGNKTVQMISLILRFLLFLIAAIVLTFSQAAPPTWLLVLFFVGSGISWSLFQLSGVALISRLAKPEYRGQALGLYNATAGVGTILAGVSSGYLAEFAGYQATFAAATVLIAVALIILYRLPGGASIRTGDGRSRSSGIST